MTGMKPSSAARPDMHSLSRVRERAGVRVAALHPTHPHPNPLPPAGEGVHGARGSH